MFAKLTKQLLLLLLFDNNDFFFILIKEQKSQRTTLVGPTLMPPSPFHLPSIVISAMAVAAIFRWRRERCIDHNIILLIVAKNILFPVTICVLLPNLKSVKNGTFYVFFCQVEKSRGEKKTDFFFLFFHFAEMKKNIFSPKSHRGRRRDRRRWLHAAHNGNGFPFFPFSVDSLAFWLQKGCQQFNNVMPPING